MLFNEKLIDVETINDLKTGSLFISDTNHESGNECQFHILSNTSTCLYLESDADNIIEEDVPYITMSQDGGVTAHRIGGSRDNQLVLNTGTAGGITGILFQISSNITDNGIGNVPSFVGTSNKLYIDAGTTYTYQDVDFNAASDLILNSRASDNSLLEFLTVDASDVVKVRTLTENNLIDHSPLKVTSLPVSTTTSSTFINKLTMNATLTAGTYYISTYCEFSNESVADRTEARVVFGSTLAQIQTPVMIDDFNYFPFSFSSWFTLAGGSYTIEIDYRDLDGGTATARNARIHLWRIDV